MTVSNNKNKIPGAYGGVYNGSSTNDQGNYNGVYGKVEKGENAGTYNYDKENVTDGYYNGQGSNTTDSNSTTTHNFSTNGSYSTFSINDTEGSKIEDSYGQGTNTTDSTWTNNNGSSSKSTYSSFSTIGTTNSKNMPVKVGFWNKVKSFLFKEIDLTAPVKIELTPYQQKVENEINDFLHQEITFSSFKNLFKK